MTLQNIVNELMGVRFEKENLCIHNEYCEGYRSHKEECHRKNGHEYLCFSLKEEIQEELE